MVEDSWDISSHGIHRHDVSLRGDDGGGDDDDPRCAMNPTHLLWGSHQDMTFRKKRMKGGKRKEIINRTENRNERGKRKKL